SGGQSIPGGATLSSNGQTLTFTPGILLSPSTVYEVVTSTGLTDVAGYPLANPGSFTFTTGVGPHASGVTILSTNPASGTTNVAPNVVVRALFSQRITPMSISPTTTHLTASGGQAVSCSLVVSADGLSVSLIPSGPLLSSITYTAFFSATDYTGRN